MPNVMIYVFKVKFPSISYKNYAQLVFNFKMPDLRWFFGIRPKKSTSKFNFEVEFTVLIRIPWDSTVEFDQKKSDYTQFDWITLKHGSNMAKNISFWWKNA